jgi:protein subunit release factor B
VNRSATCIYLKHKPTGLEVKMQQARSQSLNRFYARRRMCELIEAQQEGTPTRADRAREKARKQKAQRRRRAKKKYGDSGEEATSD